MNLYSMKNFTKATVGYRQSTLNQNRLRVENRVNFQRNFRQDEIKENTRRTKGKKWKKGQKRNISWLKIVIALLLHVNCATDVHLGNSDNASIVWKKDFIFEYSLTRSIIPCDDVMTRNFVYHYFC